MRMTATIIAMITNKMRNARAKLFWHGYEEPEELKADFKPIITHPSPAVHNRPGKPFGS